MKTEKIKQRLYRYIETANEKKLKAIYTMVEEEIEEISDLWNVKNSLQNWSDGKKNILVVLPKHILWKKLRQGQDKLWKK